MEYAIIAAIIGACIWGRRVTKDDDDLPKGKRGW